MTPIDPDHPGTTGESDPLEAALHSLNLADRAPDPTFTHRVLAALPPPDATTRGVGLPGARAPRWRAALAPALVGLGLLIMVATGDAFGLLGAWWQDAGDWLAAAASDAADLGALLDTIPGGGLAPEAYLGLVLGACFFILGTGAFLLHTLSPPALSAEY